MISEECIKAMETYGGSFVQALVNCWWKADSNNRAILKKSFAHYFKQYQDMADKTKRKEE